MNNVLRVALASLFAMPSLVLAQAACPAGTVQFDAVGKTITMAVTGSTMCAVRGGDRWQEFHQAGGVLIDYKLGPGDAVDPSEQVGTWSTNDASSTGTHNYGSGGAFTWRVCRPAAGVSPLTLVSTGGAGTVANVGLARGGPLQCP